MSDPNDHFEGEEPRLVSAKEAYRLKHEINKTITYGPGLNAQEVAGLQQLDAKQWKTVSREYDNWARQGRWFNTVVLRVVGVVGGVGFVSYFQPKGWVGWAVWVGGAAALFCLVVLVEREQHREGYMDGYDAGFSDGINKAFGIDEKEAKDIHDRAIEMEIDEGVLKAFDNETRNSK